MIISGKFKQSAIRAIYKQYIDTYVKCINCGGKNTTMVKDKVTRL